MYYFLQMKTKSTMLIIPAVMMLASCVRTKDIKNIPQEVPPAAEEQKPEPEVPQVIPETEPVPEPPKEPEKTPEPKKEEVPLPPKEDVPPQKPAPAEEVPPAPAEEKEADEDADEYARSIGDVGVSKDTFKEDKEKILRIIDELSVIMKDKDYKAWLPYIDSESKSYWSKTGNLKKAQNRMPIKGIQLKTLQDYFKFIFVPARQQSQITEIRYESDTYIKAVEVQPTQELIYYFFKKTNGNWLVHIPPIEE